MTRLEDTNNAGLDARLEATVARLEQVQVALGQGRIDRMISTAFRKEERKLRRELNSLVKNALRQSLGELAGGKGGASSGGSKISSTLIDSLFGFIPGFARGGVLSRKTRLAHGGEAGPEAVLPLKKGADGRLGVAVQGRSNMGGAGSSHAGDRPSINITITQPQDKLRRAIDMGDLEGVEAALSREIDHAIDARIRSYRDASGGFGQPSSRLF